MGHTLVVDDEEGIRSFISEVLEGEGLRVSQAPDGEAAARLLERESFHLMLTDLKMPRMDGMSLLRKARATQAATRLGIGLRTLYDKLRAHGID